MAPYFSRIWINLSALNACDLILFLLSLSPFFLGAVGGPEIPPDGWFVVCSAGVIHLTLTTWRVPFWRLGVADLVSVRVSVLVKQDRGAPDNRSTVYNEVIAHVHFGDPLVISNTLHKFKSV